jgi:hypothetical protein
MEKILQKLSDKINSASDINEHLDNLKKYASECDIIIEMGVRAINSTWAFLAAKPKKLVSIDFQHPSVFDVNIEEVSDLAKENDIDFEFRLQNTLECEIEECDLLFIDTWHDYLQLKCEIYRHEKKVRKYIIFHDTNSFGFRNEDNYETYSLGREETNLPKGLIPAIDEFLFSNKEWYIHERFANNNGITIIKRK